MFTITCPAEFSVLSVAISIEALVGFDCVSDRGSHLLNTFSNIKTQVEKIDA